MTFENEAFISYAHLDDQELIEGQKGWVTNFHRALQIRVGQLLGKEPTIWRDCKLQGNDVFAETLVERLRKVATLVSVLSPRYVNSEWTLRELSEFCKAAEQSTGICVGDKARVFKILKTPVPLEMHPPELQSLLGYEFFKIDPESGRVRELDQMFGLEAQREFWLKVADVAHDLCDLLLELECPDDRTAATGPGNAAVYLAETTRDVIEVYDTVRRDLKDHARAVVPPQTLPLLQSDLEAYVRAQLSHCCLSIHLVGKNYGIVPEEWQESLPEIQYRLTAERAASGNFTRLIWVSPGLQVQDERQRKFLDRLRGDPALQKGTDLLETPLDELRNAIYTRLKPPPPKPVQNASRSQPSAPGLLRVYFIYDQRDAEATAPWENFLFNEGFEVLHPVFEGDEAEIREYHEDNLRTCDAVLIYYGAGNECWLRKKLREVQKIAGYGRIVPMRAVGITVAPPVCPAKQNLRTHEAMVISQLDGFTPDPVGPFIQLTRKPIERQAIA